MNDTLSEKEIAIQKRITTAFENSGKPQNTARDIGFHMTDWISDLEQLREVYSNIDNLSDDEITRFIYKFLAHVPNHLNAAMKLSGMGKVEDVFGVNIFEDDE